MRRVFLAAGLAGAVALAVVASVSSGTPRHDYAAVSRTVLPPGQNGGLSFDRNTNDQANCTTG